MSVKRVREIFSIAILLLCTPVLFEWLSVLKTHRSKVDLFEENSILALCGEQEKMLSISSKKLERERALKKQNRLSLSGRLIADDKTDLG